MTTMQTNFEYYYGNEADQYSFYRIPKVLFTDERFKSVSAEAKVLYGLMLDRMGLSLKNSWLDDRNRVYIIYTVAEIMETLGCAEQKANKLLMELDSKSGVGLIEKRRRGLGKPNIIYVKNFIVKSQFQNHENHNSGTVETTIPEPRKSQGNKTDLSETDFSDTNLSINPDDQAQEPAGDRMDTIEDNEFEIYTEIVKENIAYDALAERRPEIGGHRRLGGFDGRNGLQ
jgi:hypothetical protein